MTNQVESHSDRERGTEIAYVMKGYGRLSDVFINNEIYLLETMGLTLHIFSAKKPPAQKSHSIVSAIQALVTYLPEVTSISADNFVVWLFKNLHKFTSSQMYVLRRHFRRYIKTLLEAVRMSFKYRSAAFRAPRKVFLQEFLQAGYIAQKILEAGRIGHLHGHFAHGSTTITMFVSQLCDIPFSFTAHAKDIYLQKVNPSDLLSIKMRRAQFVVTCTAANSVYLKNLCPDVSTIHTIYHGLDTTRFTRAALQGRTHPRTLLLSVGRFVEKKGFTYLVQACRILKDRGHEFRCRLIGEADDQSDLLARLISDLRLEDTVFMEGPVTQEEMTHIYDECTIFALPCQVLDNGDRDGIPNVLVEAMAMEIPVVSTDISGIPELIENGIDGLLVQQKDATALAHALEQLLSQPGLRSELGRNGRDKVRRLFDNKKTTLALRALFVSSLQRYEEVTSVGQTPDTMRESKAS